MCSSAHRHFFLFRPRVFSRVLSAPGHARSPPELHGASVGSGRGSRHAFSGDSKSLVTTGRHSEHVEPFRPMQTHVQDKTISDGSYGIYDIECRQCRQTLLDDGKVFPRHQLARHATTFSTIRYNLHDLGRIFSFHARSCVEDKTTRWLSLHLRPTAVRVRYSSCR